LIEYFTKYSTEELEKAGYLEEASAAEMRAAQQAATYNLLRDNGLSVKLSRKECERLVLLAVDQDVSVDELVKKWLKERLRLEGRRTGKSKASGSRV
jgi:predicted HicB family RNase H-like nuclease